MLLSNASLARRPTGLATAVSMSPCQWSLEYKFTLAPPNHIRVKRSVVEAHSMAILWIAVLVQIAASTNDHRIRHNQVLLSLQEVSTCRTKHDGQEVGVPYRSHLDLRCRQSNERSAICTTCKTE